MPSKYNDWRIREVIDGMELWFNDINSKKAHKDGRTLNESVWDSGVFAASEFVRRLTGDEDLALAIHGICVWSRNELSKK